MSSLKRRRSVQLDLAEHQADVNRDLIDSIRKIQQEMRGMVARQHGIERAQEQLALALIRAATAIGGTPPGSEVSSGR